MTKKHLVQFGYVSYVFDSITAATQAVAFFSKLKPVKINTTPKDYDRWYYEEDKDRNCDIELKLNQRVGSPEKPKPAKSLALPSPKRGTILCICEKSYVAPRESCPHCGRDFSESHNRTHSEKKPNLRLL